MIKHYNRPTCDRVQRNLSIQHNMYKSRLDLDPLTPQAFKQCGWRVVGLSSINHPVNVNMVLIVSKPSQGQYNCNQLYTQMMQFHEFIPNRPARVLDRHALLAKFIPKIPARVLRHTEDPKKLQSTRKTTSTKAKRRRYRTTEVEFSLSNKSRKKVSHSRLFSKVSTIDTSSILLINFRRPPSERSRRPSPDASKRKASAQCSMEHLRQSPVGTFLKKSMRVQLDQIIHDAVITNSLNHAKSLASPIEKSAYINQKGTLGKKERIIEELNQAGSLLHSQRSKIHQSSSESSTPVAELNRLGRFVYKTKVDREQFIVQADLVDPNKKSNMKQSSKLMKQSARQGVKEEQGSEQKLVLGVEKQPQKSQYKAVTNNNSDSPFAESVILETLQTISDSNPKLEFNTKLQQKLRDCAQDLGAQGNSSSTSATYRNRLLGDLLDEDIGMGGKDQYSQLKPPQIVQSGETLQTLEKRNQYIVPVGVIVGHGLKLLKDIKINWILPCIPIYKKFHQFKVDIQRLAQKHGVDNQFVCRNRSEIERIQDSYANMVKAAQKKPISSQQLVQLHQQSIKEAVSLQDIVKAAERYFKTLLEFEGKSDQLALLKTHFAMIINSILVVASYEEGMKDFVQIDHSGKDIDMELVKGLGLVRNLL